MTRLGLTRRHSAPVDGLPAAFSALARDVSVGDAAPSLSIAAESCLDRPVPFEDYAERPATADNNRGGSYHLVAVKDGGSKRYKLPAHVPTKHPAQDKKPVLLALTAEGIKWAANTRPSSQHTVNRPMPLGSERMTSTHENAKAAFSNIVGALCDLQANSCGVLADCRQCSACRATFEPGGRVQARSPRARRSPAPALSPSL